LFALAQSFPSEAIFYYETADYTNGTTETAAWQQLVAYA
jgi:hypothetical protein